MLKFDKKTKLIIIIYIYCINKKMYKKNLLEWEKYLKEQENDKYIKNREKFSSRFGKNNLLNLLENGKDFLEKTDFDDKFKISFVSKVLNPLKNKY
jgi:hypothetical protein